MAAGFASWPKFKQELDNVVISVTCCNGVTMEITVGNIPIELSQISRLAGPPKLYYYA